MHAPLPGAEFSRFEFEDQEIVFTGSEVEKTSPPSEVGGGPPGLLHLAASIAGPGQR
jgi:hypothetical protein